MGNVQSVPSQSANIQTFFTQNEIDQTLPIEKKIEKGAQVLHTATAALSDVIQALEKTIMKLHQNRREEGTKILKRIAAFLSEVSLWSAYLLKIVTGHKAALRLSIKLLEQPITDELVKDLESLLAKETVFTKEMEKCSQLITTGADLIIDINKFVAAVNDDRSSNWAFMGCIFGTVLSGLGLLACVVLPPCVLVPAMGVIDAVGLISIVEIAAAAGAVCASLAANCGSTATTIKQAEKSIQTVVNKMEELKKHVEDHTNQLKEVNISLIDAQAKHHIQETLNIAVKYDALEQLQTGWMGLLTSTENLEKELEGLVKICNNVGS